MKHMQNSQNKVPFVVTVINLVALQVAAVKQM